MQIIEFENAKKVPFDLDGRIMYSNNPLELIQLTLKPKEVLALHSNPFDVVFYLVKGEGKLSIENESQIIQGYSTIFVEKGKQRGWENTNDEDLVLLVIKLLND